MTAKKIVSLSFLLLANVVILVHSVVFHHHDHLTPVVLCVISQEHHCDGTTEHHCHDTENTNKCCIIENCSLNAPFTKANSCKLIKPVFNNFDFIINNIPANQITQIADLKGLPFRQKPYLPLFYSEFISQSMGLRAPPDC